MSTEQTLFDDLLSGRRPMDGDTLRSLVLIGRRYPYFQLLRMLYLRNLAELRSVRYADELRRSVVYLPDRVRLFSYLDAGEYAWSALLKQNMADAMPTSGAEAESFELIDSYLRTTSDEPYPEQLEDLLPHVEQEAASADYVSTLLDRPDLEPASAEAEPDANQQLIDSFIEKDEREGLRLPLEEPLPDAGKAHGGKGAKEEGLMGEESFLTESLAKIYIKQKKYGKALEIIKKLSLKYPEKNVYFADQIRFLEKIITNIKPE